MIPTLMLLGDGYIVKLIMVFADSALLATIILMYALRLTMFLRMHVFPHQTLVIILSKCYFVRRPQTSLMAMIGYEGVNKP